MDTEDRTRAQYARLLQAYAALPAQASREERWTWLMAAHVAGQPVLALHFDSHLRMLRLAWTSGDAAEAAGQLLRLALVPLGHALGRLPEGNVGRATVSAFRTMRPPREVRRVLAWASSGRLTWPWDARTSR